MIKLPSYIRDSYFLNSYVKFENTKKLPLNLTSRTITYQMFSDFDKILDLNKIEIGEMTLPLCMLPITEN